MKRMMRWAAAGVTMAALSAAAQSHMLDQTVATELLRGDTGQMAIGALQNSPDFARAYTVSVLEQELAQESARRGLPERLDVARALLQARYQVLIQALQADVARGQPPPTDADVKSFFEKNKKDMVLPEAVKADLFAVDGTDSNALEVVRSAVAAQKIDPVALRRARNRQVAAAAQVWVGKDVFPEEVWKSVRQMVKNQIQFFRVQGNYWLIRYEDYRAPRPATLEEVSGEIRNKITQERVQKAWDAYVKATQKKIGLGE